MFFCDVHLQCCPKSIKNTSEGHTAALGDASSLPSTHMHCCIEQQMWINSKLQSIQKIQRKRKERKSKPCLREWNWTCWTRLDECKLCFLELLWGYHKVLIWLYIFLWEEIWQATLGRWPGTSDILSVIQEIMMLLPKLYLKVVTSWEDVVSFPLRYKCEDWVVSDANSL